MSKTSKEWTALEKRFREAPKKRTRLFKKIKQNEALICELHHKYCGHVYEDRVYRFYHASLKVFWLQEAINDIMDLLKKLNPHRPPQFDEWFMEIIEDARRVGAFRLEYNKCFPKHARPVLEAYFHCKYFLDMLMKSLKLTEDPKNILPSGWAALLELYNLRY